MKKTKKNKGFTLIEILVVIGLIAILATVVLIAINPARQFRQANDSQRSANVNAILNAIGQYSADNKGGMPSIPDGEVTEALCDDLVPKYLPALPTDPTGPLKGKSISDCNDVTGSNVDYVVADDSTGRVTVSAPNTQEAADDISVTR